MTLWLVLGALALAAVIAFVLFRRKLPAFRLWPTWTVSESAADTRKWVALLASFGGAVALSAGAVGLTLILWKGGFSPSSEAQRIDILGWSVLMLIGGTVAINISYGFVITPRKIKVGKDGIEASGGDEIVRHVEFKEATTTTTTTAGEDPVP